MPLDTLYRHQQALDSSALTIIIASVHAVAAAIDDCRQADRDPDADAAVILLARHLGRIAEAIPAADGELRQRCIERIAAIRGNRVRRAREGAEVSVALETTRIAA
ncbi:hypothetical protein QLH51_05725 [Sphingomonas sp. 2R-10]|uniref:hypothetical protein n=1 Tax=Sphingomonas sp. 2R-10 TaxID=3045148 RepID=UPI000F77AFA5|nr:hypothetical protein [Sphingomonas sp. 2R-10]MDJ0276296.1 hypothetical protein [Sphingomonas sp. 2R-10]